MNRGDFQLENNLAAGADEAVQSLDQQVFQALLFSSFINQQGNARGTLNLSTRLQVILETLRKLAQVTEESLALNLVAAQAVQITGATGAAIALARAGEMVCQATTGATAPDLGASFSLESGLSGECVRSARTLLCDDAENDGRVNREGARSLRVRSMMLTPIIRRTAVIGVLEVFAAQPGSFAPDDIATLEILAEIMSLHLACAAERELRRVLEAERSGPLAIPERPPGLPPVDHGASLRLTRALDLLAGGSPVNPSGPEPQ